MRSLLAAGAVLFVAYSFADSQATPVSLKSVQSAPQYVTTAIAAQGIVITAAGQFTPNSFFTISGPGTSRGFSCGNTGGSSATILQQACQFKGPVAAGALQVGVCTMQPGFIPFCTSGGLPLIIHPAPSANPGPLSIATPRDR